MKHFRRKIVLTVVLAAVLVIAFSWIVTWQNYRILSEEAANEKPLNREAVNYTLKNLREAWGDFEQKVTNRYVVDAVFASLALGTVIEDDVLPEDGGIDHSAVVTVTDGGLSAPGSVIEELGLEESFFEGKSGCFAAPGDPSTLVTYSRIQGTDSYSVVWFEDTVLYDIVEDTINIPGIMKRTEIAYDVSAMFLSRDSDSGDISGIIYKNDRSFSDCENLEDLGLTAEDLEKNDRKASGTLTFDGVTYSYVSGESVLPAGYVVLLDPVPNLFAKAFGQAGYMIAALVVLLTALLVGGFSLYPYVRNNILTPEEEKTYLPSHVRSLAALFGVLGLIIIALSGMLIYALNGLYDDAARGRERLETMEDSLSMYSGRFGQNMQSFEDIYLDFGRHIAEFLDTYPELRDREALATLAESISASSITLYDSKGKETVSSGPWIDLELGRTPGSATYDFRRILTGVPSIIHDLETDERTGLSEMRLGVRIRDDADSDRYGVVIISADILALSDLDANSLRAVREILVELSDPETRLWIADSETGRILVSDTEELEGRNITETGLGESDLKGSLIKTLKTGDGSFFVTSASMETPANMEWAEAPGGIIAYCRGVKTSRLAGMLGLVLTGCILFLAIYVFLAWIIFKEYTVEFFEANKHVKGDEERRKKKKSMLFRSLLAVPPGRRGAVSMEIVMGVFLIQMMSFIGTGSASVRNTVYYYISAGDWERGFNLFALAAILILLSKVVLLEICVRLLTTVCGAFAGAKGKTIFRLIANVFLYIALFFFLIMSCEYLGFSRTAIAGGMGSLALAISLGAQNFVADIFAGLTFVFEGTVHVGDIVELMVLGSPVFQGKVMEIGVRCMKILTREGDLITCGNRDIRMIKNSTQMNSRVICEMTVSSALPADEIEQMLKTELTEIGRTERRILNGPVYNGVSGISNGMMTLSVSAECSEEDFFYVRDKLNVSLQRIFREHGYII